MKLNIGLFILLHVLFSSDQIPASDQDHPILLRGGTIHTVSHGSLEKTDLLFENGKIVSIGGDLSYSPETELIDVTGQHIFPGLISAGSTLGIQEIGAVRATKDYAEVGDLNPNVRANVSYNPDSELIPVSRSNGSLLALSVPRSGMISGTSSLMILDGWTWEDATLKHPVGLHLFWPSMNVPKPHSGKKKKKEAERRGKEEKSSFLFLVPERSTRYSRILGEGGDEGEIFGIEGGVEGNGRRRRPKKIING